MSARSTTLVALVSTAAAFTATTITAPLDLRVRRSMPSLGEASALRPRRHAIARAPTMAIATPDGPDKPSVDVPKTVDVAVAAIGAGLSILALNVAEQKLGVRLYAPPLAASSIIIFSGITPPSAKNVFVGTLGAAAFALCLEEFFGASATAIELGRAAAVAGSLIWFKSSGLTFPPAAAMAVVYLDSPLMQESGWSYLVFPCLSGQLFLYVAAAGLAKVRQRIRVAITQRQLDFSSDNLDDFRELFDRFDTSGDGLIDATELKVALRVLTGAEVDLSDAEALVAEADCDGDGVIDFGEFVQMLKFDSRARGEECKMDEKDSAA